MRIDHHAYQRATQVAAFGLLLQLIIGIALLVFGLATQTTAEVGGVKGDTAFQFSGLYVLCGAPVWLALIILFYQHRAERLEALEQDEAGLSDVSSIFDADSGDAQVAARRLRIMYKWLMPLISLVLAVLLAGLGGWIWRHMGRLGAFEDGTDFLMTRHVGWAVAICLSFALIGFIFSRFVAGMAKLSVWQNLRGGASFIVGTALVMLAVAAGVTFRFFDNNTVIEIVTRALPIFMWLQAGEIVLNFILNLYRPRVPGEMPRPAFDSKILSLLAAPDSLVRSMNEAVNYQFGFDVTSTWGYQLLLRSFIWLIALGFVALIVLNTMVIVEPHEQAVKLAGGRIVGDKVHDSGIMWKLPWPFQTAEKVPVGRIRQIPLTAMRIRPPRNNYYSWGEENVNASYNVELQPFIVSASHLLDEEGMSDQLDDLQAAPELLLDEDETGDQAAAVVADEQTQRVASLYSLVDAEITLQYRIKRTNNGLLDYLRFSSDQISSRQRLTDRERALRSMALGVVSERLISMSLDEVVSYGRDELAATLVDDIQARFDNASTGVDVVAINFPMIRPSGKAAAESFEEIGIALQNNRVLMARVQRDISRRYMMTVGRADFVQPITALIEEYDRLRNEAAQDDERIDELRSQIEQAIIDGGGGAAMVIAEAEQYRWDQIMQARSRASQLNGQLSSYLASPELFQQRMLMDVYSQMLANIDVRKFVLGIDPSRIDLRIEWRERDSALNITDVISPDTTRLETN